MAIKFVHIISKEVRVAESEPQIAALWASSDHSPNITQGQDFGWRLAPEVVVEMERILRDEVEMTKIAHRYGLPLEDVGETDILQYISEKTSADNAPVAKEGDYAELYQQEIRRLRGNEVAPVEESIEELEARLKAKKAEAKLTEKPAA